MATKRIDQLTAHPRSAASPLTGSALLVVRDGALASDNTRSTTVSAMRGFASVKDYGAVGNGSTDDAAAIQACVNAQSVVYFPPGNYKINTRIDLKSNLKIFGDGPGLCKVTVDAALSFGFYASGLPTPLDNIEISGIYFLGHKAVTNLTILEFRDTSHAYVHGCTLDTAKQYSIGFTRGMNHGFRVEDNLFLNTGSFAMETAPYPDLDGYRLGVTNDVTFINNTVYWDSAPAAPVGDAWYGIKFNNCDKVQCIGNKFTGVAPVTSSAIPNSSAIHVTNSRNLYIAGNEMKWCLFGISLATQVTGPVNVVVTGNVMQACYYGIQPLVGTRVVISDNVFEAGALNNGTSDSAMHSDGSGVLAYAQIHHNVFNHRILLTAPLNFVNIRDNMSTGVTASNGSNTNVSNTNNVTVS